MHDIKDNTSINIQKNIILLFFCTPCSVTNDCLLQAKSFLGEHNNGTYLFLCVSAGKTVAGIKQNEQNIQRVIFRFIYEAIPHHILMLTYYSV